MGQLRVDRASRVIAAPAETVFRALVDPDLLMAWLPPEGMTGTVHRFEPREGGAYEIELTYNDPAEAPGGAGKSDARSDIVRGTFVEIAAPERLVQTGIFDADDPAFAGTMIMTWTLEAEGEGTRVTIEAIDVPSGISAEDHREGLNSSLANLARLFGDDADAA